MKRIEHLKTLRPIALAVMLAVSTSAAHADERESMEVLRQTTLNLIGALVENGVLTREKANELIREAEKKAAYSVALQREKEGVAPPATAVAVGAASTPVRVQYIPDSVKKEIRDQIRKEVLSQAREEHWADPNAIPSWLDRVKVSGDILTRYQFDNYASNNTAPNLYDQSGSAIAGMTTRNAALADKGNSSGNTQNDISTGRLRVRLGIDAKISDAVRTEVRLASGSSDSRVSTTQTLGSNFNKYSLWLDRGFIRYDPVQWSGLLVGRMSNPFLSSDLVWDDNINFDGLALSFKDKKADGFVPYATIGAFPLTKENEPDTTFSRTLFAAQVGASADVSRKTRARLGVAYYNFHRLEGRVESNDDFNNNSATYLNSEYGSTLRQKGNTLVRINASDDVALGRTKWGLASRFAPLHIGFGLDNARTDALHLILSADYVKNMAFDRTEIERRTGLGASFNDGRSTGHQIKFQVGAPAVRKKGQWNASVAFRSLGSDAVPDAFADGTLGGGGTNVRGYILGFNYGLDTATTFGIKYLSGRNIDSPSMLSGDHTFKLNTLQVDLGVSF